MEKHNFFKAFIILLTICAHIIMLVINYLATFPQKSMGLFTMETGNVSHKYNLEITPHDKTFMIWGIIYSWESIWLLYVFTTLFRKSNRGPLYVYPPVTPSSLFILYIFNCILNSVWLILFDRQQLFYCAIILFFIPLKLIFALILGHVRLEHFTLFMFKVKMNKDIWCNRLLTHNGLAMNATWVCLAFCLNFAMVLVYEYNVAQDVASSLALTMMSIGALFYVAFDYKRKSTHYTVTPYIVLCWASVGIITKNYDLESAKCNSLLSVCLLSGSGVVLFFKLLSILMRKEVKITKQK